MKKSRDIEPGEISRPQPSSTTGSLFRIAGWATGLGFGCVSATVESIRPSSLGLSFTVSGVTLLAFLGGFLGGWFYWKLIARRLLEGRSGTLWFRASSSVIALVALGAFFYPIRFLPREQLPGAAEGLLAAVLALSIGAYLLWRLKRFLEQDGTEP